MAITQDDFKKVWASTSSVPQYTFSDTDYKNGWEFVGNLPPTRAMWDELQRKNDEKMQFLQENGSMCFDSVADMKSSNLDAGQTVFTKGYYSINDGGAGIYTIRAMTASDVEDGGSVIFLANGNVAELIIGDSVNVHQFGAKGDGVTDDTVAIQHAIDTHVPVELLSNHTYIVISFNIYHGFVLKGNGGKLKRPNLKEAPYNYTDAQINVLRMFDISTIGENINDLIIRIENITIDINCFAIWSPDTPFKYEQGVLFYVIGNSNHHAKVSFCNVVFLNNYTSNVTIGNYVDITFERCVSFNCFKGICTIVGGSVNVVIDGVKCDSDYDFTAFWYEPNSSTVWYDLSSVLISNCFLNGKFKCGTNGEGSVSVINSNLELGIDSAIIAAGNTKVLLSNCKIVIAENNTLPLRGRGTVIFSGCDIKTAKGLISQYTTAADAYTKIIISGCSLHDGNCGIVFNTGSHAKVQVNACHFFNITDRVFGSPFGANQKSWEELTISNSLFDVTGYISFSSGSAGEKAPKFKGGNDVINAENKGIYTYGSSLIEMNNEIWSTPVPINTYRSGVTYNCVGVGQRLTLVTETPTFKGINDIDYAQLTVSPYTKYKYTNNAWVEDV